MWNCDVHITSNCSFIILHMHIYESVYFKVERLLFLDIKLDFWILSKVKSLKISHNITFLWGINGRTYYCRGKKQNEKDQVFFKQGMFKTFILSMFIDQVQNYFWCYLSHVLLQWGFFFFFSTLKYIFEYRVNSDNMWTWHYLTIWYLMVFQADLNSKILKQHNILWSTMSHCTNN